MYTEMKLTYDEFLSNAEERGRAQASRNCTVILSTGKEIYLIRNVSKGERYVEYEGTLSETEKAEASAVKRDYTELR